MLTHADVALDAAERAGNCPVCGRELTAADVNVGVGKNGDLYPAGRCADCGCRYDDDYKQWTKPTRPGVEAPTWDV